MLLTTHVFTSHLVLFHHPLGTCVCDFLCLERWRSCLIAPSHFVRRIKSCSCTSNSSYFSQWLRLMRKCYDRIQTDWLFWKINFSIYSMKSSTCAAETLKHHHLPHQFNHSGRTLTFLPPPTFRGSLASSLLSNSSFFSFLWATITPTRTMILNSYLRAIYYLHLPTSGIIPWSIPSLSNYLHPTLMIHSSRSGGTFLVAASPSSLASDP